MVEFISAPVISGFCSAAALTVASTQVKGLFGLKFKGSSFVEIWKGFLGNITKCSPWDSALGCSMILILLLMRVCMFGCFYCVLFLKIDLFYRLTVNGKFRNWRPWRITDHWRKLDSCVTDLSKVPFGSFPLAATLPPSSLVVWQPTFWNKTVPNLLRWQVKQGFV